MKPSKSQSSSKVELLSTSEVKAIPSNSGKMCNETLKLVEKQSLLSTDIRLEGRGSATFSGQVSADIVCWVLVGLSSAMAACYIGVQLSVDVHVRGRADVQTDISSPRPN